jgi:hypothetical protein
MISMYWPAVTVLVSATVRRVRLPSAALGTEMMLAELAMSVPFFLNQTVAGVVADGRVGELDARHQQVRALRS